MVLSGIKVHRGIQEIISQDSYQKYIRDPMGKERRFQEAKKSNNSIVLEMNQTVHRLEAAVEKAQKFDLI